MRVATSVLPTRPKPKTTGRVLVVEDEEALRRANARILQETGFVVTQAADGLAAAEALKGPPFDAILSDISMPGMDGIALLRRIRETDLDVPVLMLTANPGVQTAVQALEFGALRYLIKPVPRADLVTSVEEAVVLGRIARFRREHFRSKGGTGKVIGDRAVVEASLENALSTLWMAYQPIVNWTTRKVVAYEALLRNDEPKLKEPGALLKVAEQFERLKDLGRAIRLSVATTLRAAPLATDVFVNLHPADLQDEQLYAIDAPLAQFARQVVLEIAERQTLNPASDIPACAAQLRALGYRIAIDDLGAGYSSLSYFAHLTPEVAKIDMSLVRDIDQQPVKQTLVASLIQLCAELGLQVVAEGVETTAERDAIAELGCELFQGYLFARPCRELPAVTW